MVTDLDAYPQWNPVLTQVEGELAVGGDLRVHLSFAPMTLSTSVTRVDKPNHFEWEDHVSLNLLKPIFSVHLLPLPDNRTRVVISESFTGPLLPFAGRRLDKQMPPLYDEMAKALAQQVEQNKTIT